MNYILLERSAWRLSWPVVMILLTALNIILAGDYMVRIADDTGPVVFWGLTRAELINWFIAFGLIASGRVLVVLLGDDKTGGVWAFLGRISVRLVIAGLVAFSIWTAAAETATKLQTKIDQGNAAAASVRAAGAIVTAEQNRARAAQEPGSEGTVIGAFGAMVPGWLGGPWSVETTIAIWGWIAAILLEVVCFAGAGATGHILRESRIAMTPHAETWPKHSQAGRSCTAP